MPLFHKARHLLFAGLAVFACSTGAVAGELSGFPTFYRLFDDVPTDATGRPVHAGPGFADGTATFDGKLYMATGDWPPVDWMLIPHHPKYALAAGTYVVNVWFTRWREQSFVNKDVAGGMRPPGHFDIQLGGAKNCCSNGAIHPRVGGTGKDEKKVGRDEQYCQWNQFVMRWGDGRPVDFFMNGIRRHAVPYDGGMEDNTADWVIGANRRPKGGKILLSHPFGGAQFEPVLFTGRLSNAQILALYKAQYAHFSRGQHVSLKGGGSDRGVKGRRHYVCRPKPRTVLPESIDRIGVGQ